MIRVMKLLFITTCLFIIETEGSLKNAVGCTSEEFQCENGECTNKLYWCDGKINCKDGSDEQYCIKGSNKDPNKCAENKRWFVCTDGMCIPKEGRCDYLKTCHDGSDERNCKGEVLYEAKIALPETQNDESVENQDNRLSPEYYAVGSKSFTNLDYNRYRANLESARDWLLSQRDEDYGWGAYTARAIIAMYLSKTQNYEKDESEKLMDKQLDIQLSIALTRNSTTKLSLSELSLYINALTAACSNPRNFYGYDLVSTLRERVDHANLLHTFVSPYVYLTLCLNNVTRFEDIRSLQNPPRSHRVKLPRSRPSISNKIDILALEVLASSCVIKIGEYNHPEFLRNIVQQLMSRIKVAGLPGNIYELSLIVQALNEAKVDPHHWNRSEAMSFILDKQNATGSFGDILATYYTIPILSGRTMLSLSDHCKEDFSLAGFTPLAVLKNTKRDKIVVRYSLFFGSPVDMSQRIQLQVAEDTNFLDIMRLAQEENPNFRFSLDDTKVIPFVYSIGGIPNDAERGLYWTLHVPSTRDKKDYIQYNKDLRHHIPKNGEETVFWLKPI